MEEGMDRSFMTPPSPEANVAARKYIAADKARLDYLMSSASLVELNERRKEVMDDSREFFSQQSVYLGEGERALLDTLVRMWTAEHPTTKASEGTE